MSPLSLALCMFTASSTIAEAIATVNSLNAKNAREHWEKVFNTHYIQPILGNLDVQVNIAMDLVSKDAQQGVYIRMGARNLAR